MIIFLFIWAVLGFMAAAILADAGALRECGPLAGGFIAFVCGPLIFAIYLIVVIVNLLSKLDKKWFS